MKNNVLIFAICFCVNTVVFGFLGYVKYKNKQAPQSEPVFVRPDVEMELIQPEPEPKQVEPEPTKPLPAKGVVVPSATTYEVRGNRLVRTGTLKPRYFNVVVLKEMIYSSKKYYLIQLKETGYLEDFWIVSKDDLFLLVLQKEKLNAFCSMVNPRN